MDTYRKILLILKDLLHKSNHVHWAQWIAQDIIEWDNTKSTAHYKSAFGGMGSINDLWVGGHGKNGTWESNLFEFLKHISWVFSTSHKIKFLKSTKNSIEGTICRTCAYAEISESNVEHYISVKHLPAMISELLPTDNFLDLVNIESLTHQSAVEADRQKLLAALSKSNIIFLATNHGLTICPTCKSADICVYRWDIVNRGDKITLRRSKNNLTIHKK